MTVLEIARATHEVNRAYCAGMGDHSHLPWDEAPQWQRDSAIAGVRAIMAGETTSPEQQHESWMKQKLSEGWVHGPTQDAPAHTHPCLVPFNDLPMHHRAK